MSLFEDVVVFAWQVADFFKEFLKVKQASPDLYR